MPRYEKIYEEMKACLSIVPSDVYVENFCVPDTFEFPTLDMVLGFAKSNPGWNILYVHTKGASIPDNECVSDWRKAMTCCLVDKYKKCILKLKEYDTVGCNYTDYFGFPHWQGNFWWAKSDYIAKLDYAKNIEFVEKPDLWEDRHKAEAWIFTGKPSYCEIYNHGINPYYERNTTYKELTDE